MFKNLFTLLLLGVAISAIAQPKNEDLTKIDPRLNNGFTMSEMKLTGLEFKGTVPPMTDRTSDIKMFIGLSKLKALQVDMDRSKFLFKIIPYFSFSSWLGDTVKKNPGLMARSLRHEQVHYDIHLLMSIELKKQLSQTWFDSKNYGPAILDIRDKLSQTEAKIRQLYQIETNDGQDLGPQQKWNDIVSKALETKDWSMLANYIKGKI